MRNRTGEAVKAPHDHDIEAALMSIGHEAVELRAVSLAPAAGTYSAGKFVVSRAGEAYHARDRGLNRMFRLRSGATFAFCLLLVLSKTPVHAAQDNPDKGDSEDKTLFLVARPEMG